LTMSEEQVAEVSAEVAPSVSEDWRSAIPEDIREHKSLSTIKDVGGLAKGFVHAQSMIGADKIAIPGKFATEDDWNPVWDKLGRPESAEAYELTNEPGEGIEANEEMLGWFKGVAHKTGLTPGQAQNLLNEYNAYAAEAGLDEAPAPEFSQEQVVTQLKKEYGAAFEDKASAAAGVVTQFAPDETMVTAYAENGESYQHSSLSELVLADGSTVGDHPDFIRTMVNISDFIASKIGEDSLEGIKSSGSLTPTEAQGQIDQLMSPGGPYWDQRHPQHDWSVQEVLRLRELSIVE